MLGVLAEESGLEATLTGSWPSKHLPILKKNIVFNLEIWEFLSFKSGRRLKIFKILEPLKKSFLNSRLLEFSLSLGLWISSLWHVSLTSPGVRTPVSCAPSYCAQWRRESPLPRASLGR